MSFIEMNKKGEENTLPKEIVSVLIFAIGFALLIYGVYLLLGAITGQENKNAENTLDLLVDRMKAVEEIGEQSFIVQGFRNSENWFLSGWNVSDPGRPDKCYFESCLCLCNEGFVGTDASAKCQADGFCRSLKYEGMVVELLNSNKNIDRMKLVLPKNAAECKIIVVKNGDLKYATIKLQVEEEEKVEAIRSDGKVASESDVQATGSKILT